MFSRILIANRGEIAVRIARTCRDLGVQTVAVYSDADVGARHVEAADQAVHLPGVAPQETYLNLPAVLAAAHSTGAEAIHPGYGFFSERADAAEAIIGAGLTWIGAPAEATRAVGDKVEARRLAQSAGVPVVPGTVDPVETPEGVHAFAKEHGYPIAIKAAGGGGGRGMRVVHSSEEIDSAFEGATREATAYFGSPGVYLERYLVDPKHVEVQILAPAPAETMWLGARDCSLQRRHQKLVEETPPPRFAEVVPDMGRAAAAVGDACGYIGAGTVEFLMDGEGRFYFLEVNARLQVEHTITEEVLGIDLVACQLRVASGEPLGFEQKDLQPRGHAIECRINAEDPSRKFAPRPGTITSYSEPSGEGVRVDSGYGQGDTIPPAYDSLVSKLITWGSDREEARLRMLRALREYVIEGVATTIPAHLALLEAPEFVDGSYTTRTVEEGDIIELKPPPGGGVTEEAPGGPVLLVEGTTARLWHPAMPIGTAAAGAAASGAVVAPMHGTILEVLAKEGDQVEAGAAVAVLEAMKMETRVAAPMSGRVSNVAVAVGDVVEAGQSIATIE